MNANERKWLERFDDESLEHAAATLGDDLRRKQLTVVSAESCTGGWIGKLFTDIAGSSDYYLGGLVTYHNKLKQSLLSVSGKLLETEGAVSEPVVRQMALAARNTTGAELTVAVTGVAGPGGGSANKPVGTVWLAWSADDTLVSIRRQFDGDRDAVRRQTVALALHGLRCLANEESID